MNRTPQHTYQVLTKRADRLAAVADELIWSSNIWMGVTVEDVQAVSRIAHLRTVPAAVRFISFEPLLENLGAMDLAGIHWAIVGGESGWHARPVEEAWIEGIRQECASQNVLFYFKQWGGTNKKKTGRLYQGRTWDAMPRTTAVKG